MAWRSHGAAPPGSGSLPYAVRAPAAPAVPLRRDRARRLVRARPGADGPEGPDAVSHGRAARCQKAARVLTVSERTKRGPRRALRRRPGAHRRHAERRRSRRSRPARARGTTCSRSGRSRRARTSSRRSRPRTPSGLPLVVAGPEKDAALADELRRRGARLEGYVETERLADLYRGAACLVQPSRFEGFGLPVLEAMACGHAGRRRRRAGAHGGRRRRGGVRRRGAARGRASARRSPTASGSSLPGLERARAFSWQRDGRARRSPSTGRYSGREGLGGRRLARARGRARALAARARCRRSTRPSWSRTSRARSTSVPPGVRVLENPRPLSLGRERQPRHRGDVR